MISNTFNFLKHLKISRFAGGPYKYAQWCISQTQQHFIMFVIVLGQHVSILTESSSGSSKKIDPCLIRIVQ